MFSSFIEQKKKLLNGLFVHRKGCCPVTAEREQFNSAIDRQNIYRRYVMKTLSEAITDSITAYRLARFLDLPIHIAVKAALIKLVR